MSYDSDRQRLPVYEETPGYAALIARLGRRQPDEPSLQIGRADYGLRVDDPQRGVRLLEEKERADEANLALQVERLGARLRGGRDVR